MGISIEELQKHRDGTPAPTTVTLLPDPEPRERWATIFSADDHLSAVNSAGADDGVGGRQPHDLTRLVAHRPGAEHTDLAKGAIVEQCVDALPDRPPAAGMMAGDRFLTAERVGDLSPSLDLVDLWLPDHSAYPALSPAFR